AFSPDGRLLAIGRGDGAVEFCDAAAGRLLQTVPEAHGGPVTGAAFSHDGRLLGTGSQDGTVKVWDTVRKVVERTLDSDAGDGSVAFSGDDELLAASSGESIILWHVADGWGMGGWLRGPEGDEISCLAFAPRVSGPAARRGLLRTVLRP